MAAGVTISGDLNWSFDRMAQELPAIQNKAVMAGGMMLKEKLKETLVAKMPAASKPVRKQTGYGGYQITSMEPLTEGIRQSKTHNGKVRIHALGSGAPNSSTFITRFYEEQTQPRYNKKVNGKKLKKLRRTGQVGGIHFFKDTVNAYLEQTTQFIGNIITSKLSIILDK